MWLLSGDIWAQSTHSKLWRVKKPTRSDLPARISRVAILAYYSGTEVPKYMVGKKANTRGMKYSKQNTYLTWQSNRKKNVCNVLFKTKQKAKRGSTSE